MQEILNQVRDCCLKILSDESVVYVPGAWPPENARNHVETAWAVIGDIDDGAKYPQTLLFAAAEVLAGECVHHHAEDNSTSEHEAVCAALFFAVTEELRKVFTLGGSVQ